MALGERLAQARRLRGYTQDDAAAALGVRRPMISYWESGARVPSDRQLAALARLYRVGVAVLLGEEGDLQLSTDTARMLFRKLDDDLPNPAASGFGEFVDFLDRYTELAEATGFDVHGLRQSPFTTGAGFDSADDARRKAEEVRAYLRLGLGPIGDMDFVCELLGITVFRAALGTDLRATISGAFFAHPHLGFSILVNLEMTPGRQRFTVAHEIAHALFHSNRAWYVLSASAKDARERFADVFAGEFLMPTEGVRRLMEEQGIGPRIGDVGDVIYLQRFFRVSYATALVRLRQARLVTARGYEDLKRARPVRLARMLGYPVGPEEPHRDPEPRGVERFPQRFLRLLRLAVRNQTISVPTAANLTGLSLDEVTDLVDDRSSGAEDEATTPHPEESLELNQFEATGVA